MQDFPKRQIVDIDVPNKNNDAEKVRCELAHIIAAGEILILPVVSIIDFRRKISRAGDV